MGDKSSPQEGVTQAYRKYAFAGKNYRVHGFDPDHLARRSMSEITAGLTSQTLSLNNLTWLALTALARDIYSRSPKGSRDFEELAVAVGLQVHTEDGEVIPVEDLLKGS